MPYKFPEVASLEGENLVGNHQCVALVQHYTRAPHTSSWREGSRVLDAVNIPIGTAIATFVNGRYPNHARGNHAALFISREGNCIRVMDQWANDPEHKPTVSSRLICSKGTFKDGTYRDPSNNAEAYSIIE